MVDRLRIKLLNEGVLTLLWHYEKMGAKSDFRLVAHVHTSIRVPPPCAVYSSDLLMIFFSDSYSLSFNRYW